MHHTLYNHALTSFLDVRGPLQKKIVAPWIRVPWSNNEIKTVIKSRKKAEGKWRRSKTAQDL